MQDRIKKIAKSLYSEECYNKSHSRIYKTHKYWARKPWYIVEKYIENYSVQGDLVMDPFCGSGCTGLEAVINGRDFIGQDLNPTALRVSSGTIDNSLDISQLEKDFRKIEEHCKSEIMELYSSDATCLRCNNRMYYKHINIGPKYEEEYFGSIYCPHCKTTGKKKILSKEEIAKMVAVGEIKIDKWVPEDYFPEKFYKDRFSYKGILRVKDMYTHRNLYALSVLLDAIKTVSSEASRGNLLLAFSNTVLHVSKLKGENVRPLGVNNYWVPDDYIEENVWFRFEDRFYNIVKAKKQQRLREEEKRRQGLNVGEWELKKKSALESMGEEIVDYFFTDPPYGDAIQYSELSYIWNAWFEDKYEIEQEIIINPVQNKRAKEFQELLRGSLDRIYTALKQDKYFTLCFQNKNFLIWESVIKKCKELGFSLVDVSIYNTYGSPFNKSWAKFSPKSDIYVTFQKGSTRENEFYNKEETVEDIIKEIFQYMEKNNISRNNNKLYDLTIAYLIWAMFYNRTGFNVKEFDIKRFTKIASEIINND